MMMVERESERNEQTMEIDKCRSIRPDAGGLTGVEEEAS